MKPCRVIVHNWEPKDLVNALATGAEDFGEYQGIAGQDVKANHVEASRDALQVARMNPPKSMLYPVSQVPAYVKFYRIDLSSLGLPSDVALDPAFVKAWEAEIDANLGQPYAWGIIAGFGLISPLLRIPWLGPWLVRQKNPLELIGGHMTVCSIWIRQRIENTVNAVYGDRLKQKFDLFKGEIGEGQENPADFTTAISPYLIYEPSVVSAPQAV